MRTLALLGAVVSIALAACALTANQAHTQPDYPPPVPFGAPRDAGHE